MAKPARKTARRIGSIVAGVALVVGLSACSSGPSTNFSSDFSVTAAVTALPKPVDAKRFEISVADLAGAADAAGLTRSGDPREWVGQLTGLSDTAPVYVPLAQSYYRQLSLDTPFESLGWDFNTIDRFGSVSAPPQEFTAMAGDLPDLPSSFAEVAPGVVTDAEGEDLIQNLGSIDSTFDNLGRPTRFAERDGLIGFGLSTPVAEGWKGKSFDSVSEVSGVDEVANALDGYDAISAVISQPTQFSGQTILGGQVTPQQAEEAMKKFDALVPPDPYDMVGIGWAITDSKSRWIAAYHFATPETAQDGAQVLRAVWEKGAALTTGESIAKYATVNDVVIKDSTVAVVLSPTEGTPSVMLYKLLMSREILFASR